MGTETHDYSTDKGCADLKAQVTSASAEEPVRVEPVNDTTVKVTTK